MLSFHWQSITTSLVTDTEWHVQKLEGYSVIPINS